MSGLKQVTDESFAADVEKSSGVLLLDFWAPWCGPCRAMEPVLEEIAAEHPELTIAQINVDENPQSAQRFDIMSIPAFIVFKDGVLERRFTGGMPKAKLLAELQAV